MEEIFIKKIFIIIIIIFLLFGEAYAIDLTEFTNEVKKYSNEYFPELSSDDLLDSISNAEKSLDASSLIKKLANSFIGEFKNNISFIFKIVGIAILCSVLKSIQSNFSQTGISEIAFYACYVLIILLIMTSFINITDICKNTISKLSNFMKILIPVILSLLLVSGNVTTVTMIQPILLSMISIITVLISNVIIPVILVSTVINVVSNVSEHINIKKISDVLKKGALWCLEIVLIIFTGVLSLEGTLSANVDGITLKTTKTVVSSAVPVVGKLLGDTVDSVIGGMTITKNALGTIGVIVIVAITILPLIKTLILMFTFNIASALVEPMADKRIVKCMSGVGESIKIIFAIMATITFLFIISVTLIINVTNFSIMYR